MSTQEQEHAWAARRLAVYALGLLDGSSSDAMRTHVEGCARCREAIERMRQDALDDLGHLPASLLASWDRRSGQLEGLHRELTRRHLESCASCRQILGDFGHEPVLHRIEALEANAQLMAMLPPQAPPPKSSRQTPRRDRATLSNRLFGGWAVVATAAAAFLLVTQMQQEHPTPLPVPTPPAATAPPSPAPSPQPAPPTHTQLPTSTSAPDFGISFISEHGIALSSPSRSGPAAMDTIRFAAPTSALRLTAEPPDGPDDARVEVELVGPKGTALVRTHGRISDFFGDGGLLLHSTGSFPPGTYELRIRGTWAGSNPEAERYRFILRYGSQP